MNKEALKKALLYGILSGIVTWLIYGLVFRLWIDKKPFSDALFGRDSIVFFVICTVAEVIGYYVRQVRKAGKQ